MAEVQMGRNGERGRAGGTAGKSSSEPSGKTTSTRRTILKWGLAGLGVAAVGGVSLAMRGTVMRRLPAGGLKVLSPQQYAVIAAVADRICPSPGPGHPSATDLQVAAAVDEELSSDPPENQELITALVGIFESGLTGALFGERIAPFTQLDAAEQDRVLEQWKKSELPPRRGTFVAFKTLCAAAYYADPRSWERTGYGGPPDRAAMRTAFAQNLVDFDALRAKG